MQSDMPLSLFKNAHVWVIGQRYTIKVKPNAKKNAVEIGDPITLYTTAPAKDNKANEAVIKLLRSECGIRTRLVLGDRSRQKVIEVLAIL